MKITEKMKMTREGLEKYGSINIVVFGDSVTHGAISPGVIDYESVYWNRLRNKLLQIRNYVPINVINSAIGGTSAKPSVARFEKQVLKFDPDLLIICFGLNDVNGTLEDYLSSLEYFFEKAKENNIDVIYMTPNMLNTYVADGTYEPNLAYAAKTAEYQNSGKMDLFMSESVKLAKKSGVYVCDCYSEWKKLAQTEDTTQLLANFINHPKREMHELFANMLFEVIMNNQTINASDESTMFKSN
jgi:lysophospholipase L1-like esterase